jgi:hypothetical protein
MITSMIDHAGSAFIVIFGVPRFDSVELGRVSCHAPDPKVKFRCLVYHRVRFKACFQAWS